ncbi:MAG: histidine--tRNA ligase [Flavobacteriales bacterium]|nr:histidine--tRNA ligase [Flavobacteriales bacterium]
MGTINYSLSGMRDFNFLEVRKRNYIINNLTKLFELYGFSPLETPSMEKRSVLFGKYGDEGDKLIYQVLKSGNFLSKINDINTQDYKELSNFISDKALRYDLTIPFARYVVQNSQDITFPFKRYQIQKVWRADRPQKGRYREFTQCDVDVIGSSSLWSECDLISIYSDFFNIIGLKNISLNINNRKILEGIFDSLDIKTDFTSFCISIDKIDKAGKEYFYDFLDQKKCSKVQSKLIAKLFELKLSNSDKLQYIKSNFINEKVNSGVEELLFILDKTKSCKIDISIDFSLARGIDYYTGSIFEVISKDKSIGSLGGGGRYDGLTKMFGKDLGSGVGISFGLERIYMLLDEFNLFPKSINKSTDVFFVNLGEKEACISQKFVNILREKGISSELFPDCVKLKKQMSYSNKKNSKYTAMIGEDELNTGKINLRNMTTGDQELLTIDELIKKIKNE